VENTPLRTERRRPLGITIIALLLAIEGIGALILALLSIAVAFSTPIALIGTVISVLIGLISLALAYGLWTLQPWAFGATVAVEIFTIVFALCNFVGMLPKNTLATTIGDLIFPVVILIYLFADKNVRPAFRS